MPTNVLLVHGYSVRSLNAYGMLPQLLLKQGFNPSHLLLSAYESLSDDVTCDDLARALEARVSGLEAAGLDIQDTAVIAHSTGAIISRRWILNRWKQGARLPSHFISLAGANHGSTLAQLGQTQLAFFFRALAEGTSVGLEVLQDLDYGSDFLLILNEEWLDAYAGATPPGVLVFSLVGDDHSELINQIFWQSHEDGSDGTVRISGGNLNYRIASIDQTAAQAVLTVKQLSSPVPHLVLHGISHTGSSGILGGDAAAMASVFPAVREALGCATPQDYAALAKIWAERTGSWSAANPGQCNSTLVFSLTHPGGRSVEDSLILIADASAMATDPVSAHLAVAPSIIGRPIQNNATPSSVSFYVNYPRFTQTYPHTVTVHITSGCPEIVYPAASYKVIPGQSGSIRPIEVVYVKITLDRQAEGTFVVIPQSDEPDVHLKFPPMPGEEAGQG